MKIVIVGSTGVGKTKLSISLAKYYDAVVINADATQVYKELNIGSAKIKEDEKEGIEHFLFDIKNPNEDYNVSMYQSDARALLEKYNNKNIIIVGGTGLYINALLYDYQFLEDEQDINLDKFSNFELLEMAKKKDVNCDIDINNRVRLERFIKRKNSDKEPVLLYNDCIFIGLTTPRENLYNIINKRVDEMFNEGLVEEVKNLYKKYPDSNILKRAIGYKEVIEYLNGFCSLGESIENVKKNSRHYAKRQCTWFNNKLNVKWFNVNYENFYETIETVKKYIDNI